MGQQANRRESATSGPPHATAVAPHSPNPAVMHGGTVISATAWADMNETERRKTEARGSLASLTSRVDLFREIAISPEEKRMALHQRAINRAYNGAPPTVPHPVDQLSSASCTACHGEGWLSMSLRISKMSHGYLANCMQCHVENILGANQLLVVANSFSGLPAPAGGPRAFPEAPPMVPHTTWMRSECLSCHGPTGLYGIRTTHPWRQNCLQCHAPSVIMEQAPLAPDPPFLPAPVIER